MLINLEMVNNTTTKPLNQNKMKFIAILVVLIIVIVAVILSPNQCSACSHDMGFGNNECEKCRYKN